MILSLVRLYRIEDSMCISHRWVPCVLLVVGKYVAGNELDARSKQRISICVCVIGNGGMRVSSMSNLSSSRMKMVNNQS